MAESVPFGSGPYLLMLALLLVARGADFLSTWVATPNLALEANPLAKKMGWKWGALINVLVCLLMACFPYTAIVIATMSVLVAARNFQSAWLMRSMGEHDYSHWYMARFREARLPLYLFCLAGQTVLVAGVGMGVVLSSGRPIPLAIGTGIVVYAGVVAFYSLLSVWRTRRGSNYTPPRFLDAHPDVE